MMMSREHIKCIGDDEKRTFLFFSIRVVLGYEVGVSLHLIRPLLLNHFPGLVHHYLGDFEEENLTQMIQI